MASFFCAAAVISVHAAAVANADTSDIAFLDQLRKNGITFDNPDDAIKRGRAVCLFLDDGYSPMQAVDAVAQIHQDLSTRAAAAFTGAAIGAYCPKYLNQLQN